MYDALVAEFPNNSDYFRRMIRAHHAHALIQLKLENLPAYRTACEAMRERLTGSSDLEASHALAWTCALGPGALADLSTPLANAKILVEGAPNNTDYHTALSGMLYRDGRFEEAVDRWNSADKVNAAQAKASGAALEGQFILAMAHHRLGHAEQSRRVFAEAQAALEQQPQTQLTWDRRAALDCLCREARAIVAATE
jgi:hypothetical protein